MGYPWYLFKLFFLIVTFLFGHWILIEFAFVEFISGSGLPVPTEAGRYLKDL